MYKFVHQGEDNPRISISTVDETLGTFKVYFQGYDRELFIFTIKDERHGDIQLHTRLNQIFARFSYTYDGQFLPKIERKK